MSDSAGSGRATHGRPLTAGDKFVLAAIACVLVAMAVAIHKQAPLLTLHCPPYEGAQPQNSEPENCAHFGILVVHSVTDLWHGTGWLLRRYRDDVNAVSTIAIAAFTCTLWWVTLQLVRVSGRQHGEMQRATKVATDAAKATADSVELARQEFISTHRPHLTVRSLHARVFGDDVPPVFRFTIVNKGQTEAINVEWRAGIVIARFDQRVIAMDGVRDDIRKLVGPMAPGLDHIADYERPAPIDPEDMARFWRGEMRLHFCGVVAYFDRTGNVRHTGFVRRLHPDNLRFILTDDPDNEYED